MLCTIRLSLHLYFSFCSLKNEVIIGDTYLLDWSVEIYIAVEESSLESEISLNFASIALQTFEFALAFEKFY